MKKTTYTGNLINYMKVRASVENQKWGLGSDYLEPMFINGIRNFFGVQLDDFGNLQYDEQEPKKGFLNDYLITMEKN